MVPWSRGRRAPVKAEGGCGDRSVQETGWTDRDKGGPDREGLDGEGPDRGPRQRMVPDREGFQTDRFEKERVRLDKGVQTERVQTGRL